MIWEHKSEIVVMMTGLKENGRVKCDRYWPQKGETMEHGNLTVSRHTPQPHCITLPISPPLALAH